MDASGTLGRGATTERGVGMRRSGAVLSLVVMLVLVGAPGAPVGARDLDCADCATQAEAGTPHGRPSCHGPPSHLTPPV